jgi:hypothetical protein
MNGLNLEGWRWWWCWWWFVTSRDTQSTAQGRPWIDLFLSDDTVLTAEDLQRRVLWDGKWSWTTNRLGCGMRLSWHTRRKNPNTFLLRLKNRTRIPIRIAGDPDKFRTDIFHIEVKDKVVPVHFINWAPRHEGVLGSGIIVPLILWPRH